MRDRLPTKQKILSQSNEDYGETKDMTREELLQLIEKAASQGQDRIGFGGVGVGGIAAGDWQVHAA